MILAISILMIVLFSIASYLFISEKQKELSQDIYVNSLAFSRLTAPSVAYSYDLYLAQNSFVYFNRDLASTFSQNDDISHIKVVSYDGEVLYDSNLDLKARYEGEKRLVAANVLDEVHSENIAVKLKDGETLFLKANVDGGVSFVDKDEQEIAPIKDGALIDYFIVPANEKYSIYYGLDYHNLDIRVARMRMRIIYLALFGIMLGMLMSVFMSGKITKPVAKLVAGAEGIARGDFKTRVDIQTSDELNFLGQAFNKMAEDLEASMQARLYQERKTTELQLATKIQDQLIPDSVPVIDGLDLAAQVRPAGEIGGDIYDFLPVNENRLLFYLGDVTGHGIPAGIISSIANALFYGYAPSGDLKNVLTGVNRVMKAKTMPTMFMTLCLMAWDVAAKKFSYSSAGHEQLVHFKASTGKSELKPAGGIALGMLPDISKTVQVVDVDLQPGDFLVCYSDGIPEAWRNEKESYGMERLQQIVERCGQLKTAEEIKNAIIADVDSFRAGYEQMDDITIIVVKRV